MKHLLAYETIDDLWQDLEATFADAPREPTPHRRKRKRQFTATDRKGHTMAAIIFTHGMPSSLQSFIRKSRNESFQVTRLNFSQRVVEGEVVLPQRIGQLCLPAPIDVISQGVLVASPADIPPIPRDRLDSAAQMLEQQLQVEASSRQKNANSN